MLLKNIDEMEMLFLWKYLTPKAYKHEQNVIGFVLCFHIPSVFGIGK